MSSTLVLKPLVFLTRTENERVVLREQIDELKQSLEHAQVQRRRKMEYDVIAEKINAIPTREELEQCGWFTLSLDVIALNINFTGLSSLWRATWLPCKPSMKNSHAYCGHSSLHSTS